MAAPILEGLITKLRETLELDALEVDETGTVDLLVDSRITVRIQELPETRDLLFLAGLGTSQRETSAEEVYRVLLQANYRWCLTVGGSLSLSPGPDPEIELAVREKLDGIDYGRFEAVLEDFISCAEYWADYLAGSSPATDEGVRPVVAEPEPGFVRV